MEQEKLLHLLFQLPAFVSALTIHEFAHAWMANRLGDDTPRRMGRLSMDPLVHLDPFGSLMFVFSALVGFGIGWAKPVPFNPRNLENPRHGAILIALAGPVSNLIQAPIWLFMLWIFRLAAQNSPALAASPITVFMLQVLSMGVIINVLLAAFNMVPIPPLDGHWVLEGLGPPAVTDFYNSIRPYSFIILIGLLWTGVISRAIAPFMGLAQRAVSFALGAGF